MVPARNLLRRHCDAYGASTSCFSSSSSASGTYTAFPALPPSMMRSCRPGPMAQEPLNQHQEPPKQQDQEQQEAHQEHHQEVGTSGSSSNNSHHTDWLQLGLGPSRPAPAHGGDRRRGVVQAPGIAAATELELFTDRRPPPPPMPGMPPTFLRPAIAGIPPASMPVPMPRAGPPWLPPWPAAPPLSPLPPRTFYAGPGCGGAQAGSSSLEMIRVVWPPPMPQRPPGAAAGIWFVLQAAQNQGGEPFLPQIPRSYLRIKDGRVTIRLLIKYLVNKLGLEDESEVEITCRGRPLLPFLTLQHVRDTIWCQRDAVSVPPEMLSSTANHVMTLQYGRRP